MEKIIEFAKQHNMFSGSCVIAAVSGGADSMCLLVFLWENAQKLGITVTCAHFNHLLRGEEADRDEDFVRSFCENRGIPFFSGRGDVAAFSKAHRTGTEEAARTLRYAFLEETRKKLGASVIATAHNADDNAETVLLNLVRGAGLRGLCGIPAVRDKIVRPLLCVTRGEIENYLAERSIPYVTDSSNLTDDYSRNRLRHNVMPLLKELNPKFSETVFKTTETNRRDEEFLRMKAQEFIDSNVRNSRVEAALLKALPKAVSSRVVRMLWHREISASHIEAVLNLCENPSPSAKVNIPGGTVFREYGDLVFGEYLSGSFAPVVLEEGQTVKIPELNLEVSMTKQVSDRIIHKSFTDFLFKITEVYGKITIRPRETGDSLRLRGRGCTKTVKKLMTESRIPAGKRAFIPVVADERGILAVYGLAIDDRGSPDTGDTVYKIAFKECV